MYLALETFPSQGITQKFREDDVLNELGKIELRYCLANAWSAFLNSWILWSTPSPLLGSKALEIPATLMSLKPKIANSGLFYTWRVLK